MTEDILLCHLGYTRQITLSERSQLSDDVLATTLKVTNVLAENPTHLDLSRSYHDVIPDSYSSG
jgi:hypothetical protein